MNHKSRAKNGNNRKLGCRVVNVYCLCYAVGVRGSIPGQYQGASSAYVPVLQPPATLEQTRGNISIGGATMAGRNQLTSGPGYARR